jgi:uncharacterized SAM-binding protein YcdF (DUF218 family)
MLSIFKLIGGPGSLGFLLLCILTGVILLVVWPRKVRLGVWWLFGVGLVHLVLASPWMASTMVNALPPYAPPLPETWRPLDTLVVLSGDNNDGRVSAARQVFREARPGAVHVLADIPFYNEILLAGIPRDLVHLDASGGTTRDQLAQVARIAGEASAGRVAVIASRLQAPRVAALIRAAGLSALLIPSPTDEQPPTGGVWRFVPTYGSMLLSRDAIYEHLALAYYRRRGWITTTSDERS